MLRCLPAGIEVSIQKHGNALHINGYEFEVENWEQNLVFLELIQEPNYLTEVHLCNLQLNALADPSFIDF